MAQPAQKKTKCERTLLITPESMIEGHPEKLLATMSLMRCLDTCLRQDPKSKVACDKATEDKATEDKATGDKATTNPRRTKAEIAELEGPRKEIAELEDRDWSRETVSLQPYLQEDSQIPG